MVSINADLVGWELTPASRSWTSRDGLIYALGIAAGQADPALELEFTTDNTDGRPQKIYPMLGAVIGSAIGGVVGLVRDSVDMSKMLHAGQRYEQLAPLPLAATVEVSGTISNVWDKGRATIVEALSELRDVETGTIYGRNMQSLFFQGVGGWGGDRGPASTPNRDLESPADVVLKFPTRADQPLLYRLTGDHNPLHTDPAFAKRGGFDRPIMHGMSVYGIVGRLLMLEFADGDPARFKSLGARFSKPTMPGDTLSISAWRAADEITFLVTNQHSEPVLTDGTFAVTE